MMVNYRCLNQGYDQYKFVFFYEEYLTGEIGNLDCSASLWHLTKRKSWTWKSNIVSVGTEIAVVVMEEMYLLLLLK